MICFCLLLTDVWALIKPLNKYYNTAILESYDNHITIESDYSSIIEILIILLNNMIFLCSWNFDENLILRYYDYDIDR